MNLRESVGIALGAVRANKLRSFLTLLGTIIGVTSVIAVVSFVEGMNRYVSEKLLQSGANVFTPWSVTLGLGFSAVIGIFFGLYPALRAARLDPVDSLRYE